MGKKESPSRTLRDMSVYFGYFVYKKANNKNKNEIVLYFIYNRTFQYSDMSLIYLFTNIFIHFAQVWKWFLYRLNVPIWKLTGAITDVSTCLHSNYMQINYFEISPHCSIHYFVILVLLDIAVQYSRFWYWSDTK